MSGTPVAGRDAFVRAWTNALSGTCSVPMSRDERVRFLAALTDRLAEGLAGGPVATGAGAEVGRRLVGADFLTPEALGCTVAVVGARLLADLGLAGAAAEATLHALLADLAAGFAGASRDRILDDQDAVRHAALVARDDAERALRAGERRFRHAALHQPLTGLPNGVGLTEALDRVIAETAPRGRVGVCAIDLDEFKAVNGSLGHRVGDRFLAAVADRLRAVAAATGCFVAHLGADEFVLVVSGTTCAEDVTKVADRALVVLNSPIVIDGHELPVSASAGVVECPADTGRTEILRAASVALHWAKSDGKGRLALFDTERNERDVRRYQLSAAMPAALDRGEFVPVYQPLVDLTTGTVRAVEALARWRHPGYGLLGADRFIELAESTGLIVGLGAYILEQACREGVRWAGLTDAPPVVSVNLAMRQIHHPGLVARVAETLDGTGLPADRLQLEITESAVIDTDREALAVLRALADLGVRIALDDFGTGYSNLACLPTLPLHEIKLAGALVQRFCPAAPAAGGDSFLATVVRLARTLGPGVTAEAVETAGQAAALRDMGCDLGQGWHFGRPSPPEEIRDRIVQANGKLSALGRIDA